MIASLSFTRSQDDRVVAGVASGFAATHGLDPFVVRAALIVTALAGGIGVLLYLLAAAFTTTTPPREPGTPQLLGAVQPQRHLAVLAVSLGLLAFARSTPLWPGDTVVGPIAVIAIGLAVLGVAGDRGAVRSVWGPIPAGRVAVLVAGRHSRVRAAIGGLLVVGGIVTAGGSSRLATGLRTGALGALLAVVGVVVAALPWLRRLALQLSDERRERIRSQERAAMAAHLHDSVLQTLALIQRSAADPRRTVALARRQERELRDWLYYQDRSQARAGHSTGSAGKSALLSSALAELVADVEDLHNIRVESVLVGDTVLEDRLVALVAAAREALVNAANHAKVEEVSLYAEVEPNAVTLYVRDRGCGFDPQAVDADRRGISRSIRERLELVNGTARVDSAVGSGTEVRLHLPRQVRTESRGTSELPS